MTSAPGFAQSQNLPEPLWRSSEIGSPSSSAGRASSRRWWTRGSTCSRTPVSPRPRRRFRRARRSGGPGVFVAVAALDGHGHAGWRTPPASRSPAPRFVIALPCRASAVRCHRRGPGTSPRQRPRGAVRSRSSPRPQRPFVSNLNFTSGQDIADLVVAPMGSQQDQLLRPSADACHRRRDRLLGAGGVLGRRPYQALQPLACSTPARCQAGPVPDIPFVNGQGGVPRSGVSAVVLNLALTESTDVRLGRSVTRRYLVGRFIEHECAGGRADSAETS